MEYRPRCTEFCSVLALVVWQPPFIIIMKSTAKSGSHCCLCCSTSSPSDCWQPDSALCTDSKTHCYCSTPWQTRTVAATGVEHLALISPPVSGLLSEDLLSLNSFAGWMPNCLSGARGPLCALCWRRARIDFLGFRLCSIGAVESGVAFHWTGPTS